MRGVELAKRQRLVVDGRTLRRYITRLDELGIPVTSDPGRHGHYSLVAGYKLPPMMFTDDEALAISVGLLASRHSVWPRPRSPSRARRRSWSARCPQRSKRGCARWFLSAVGQKNLDSLLAVGFAVRIKEGTVFHRQALRDTYDLNRPD